MITQQFLGLLGFAFVSSITPGPNNMMLMASGANYGLRRTIPHMLGVAIGFTVMIVLVGVGLVGLFEAWPPSFMVLKVVSAAYLVWLAWKIALSPAPATVDGDSSGRPMTFMQAALFQWVNPKAWTMALTAIAVYAGSRSVIAVLGVAAVFGAINLPTVGVWAVMGQYLRRWMTDDTRRRVFNWGMAVLLVGSLAVAL
ncbi:LysE family translocator [Sphingomonas sp. SUN039]|uniref:LysE family translocator n=1 Tax=Sphingomonas sp. SUN039 TaxID=2937787 RepID=UPI0021643551|nr:LysE family translocator [Sphingomonas sp. SUN039]UVO53478.1 LysE family translocator [Sphingomonas sp. SUN039]